MCAGQARPWVAGVVLGLIFWMIIPHGIFNLLRFSLPTEADLHQLWCLVLFSCFPGEFWVLLHLLEQQQFWEQRRSFGLQGAEFGAL